MGKKNKTPEEITSDSITERIADIVLLIKSGFTNTIISLVISKKYNQHTRDDFVKMVKHEYFMYNGIRLISRIDGKEYITNDTLMELEAMKIIGMESRPI